MNTGLTLSDLPLHMLNNILYRFSDGWDIVTLGQVTPTLYMLSEDRRLWKRLCQYHFAEKQVSLAAGSAASWPLLSLPSPPADALTLIRKKKGERGKERDSE